MKTKSRDQLSLFDSPAPTFAPTTASFQELLREQILRDMATLREDPNWPPGKWFFEQRIASFQEKLNALTL
jgi:hypothetical protein